MLYLSIVMGALTGRLTDVWLARAGVRDYARLMAAVVVAVLVAIFTFTGALPSF